MTLKHTIYTLLTAAAALLATACVNNDIDGTGFTYDEGLPISLRLKVGVPEAAKATRTDIPDGEDSKIRSLWVGIFSARDNGKCTFAKLIDADDPILGDDHTKAGFYELDIDNTLSGLSYIVAVGNPADNFGYQFDPSQDDYYATRIALTNILPASTAEANQGDNPFTWEDYKNIAIRQLDLNDINTPIGNLVMSGIYYPSTSEPDKSADWEQLNYQPVQIPASANGQAVTLDGAIHLRRLISQVKFKINSIPYPDSSQKPNKSGIKLISVIPQSYRVRNVPYTSWLHERPADTDYTKADNRANSGDVVRVSSSSLTYPTDAGELAMKINYRTSVSFNGSQYISGSDEDGYEFDFWMLENKRWATSDISGDYDAREREVKGPHGEFETNTGRYVALCGEDGSETLNNCASFVEIQCRILYEEDGLDAIRQEEEYEQVQYRSADVTYTVHMGGIGGNWNDYTHRRNHIYTYEVTVADIDRIIVEAKQEDGEQRPSIEGIVTDVVNPPFEMDAHYGVVNIRLTNQERTGVVEMEDGSLYYSNRFPFRLRIYDGNGDVRFIDQETYQDEDPKYWTWIELRATQDSTVLATYKPVSGEWSDGGTFRLDQIADLQSFPGHVYDDESPSAAFDQTDSRERWYTVFVNEYTYEDSADERGNSWVDYVNQPPRMCWFNTLEKISKDQESNYIRSKFVIRQQSIQTFYTLPANHRGDDVDGIGLEHTDETFGFNLRWDDITTEYSAYEGNSSHIIKNNNGRHNTLLYLKGTPASDGNNYTKGSVGDRWEDYVRWSDPQVIYGINTSSNQYDITPELKEPPYYRTTDDSDIGKHEPYYLPSVQTYITGSWATDSGRSDINTTYYLRILDACMNRNRDNNGNGVIDTEELRWYVPASSEMVDLVLGRNSLDMPLIDYNTNHALNSPASHETEQSHQANTRFHYATSNQRVLWAEEGTTINPEVDHINMYDGKYGWNLPPQHVRCVRALGTDLRNDENKDLSPAFTTNSSTRPTEIYPTYYESKNQRPYSPDIIQPHQETSTLNRLCYYGFEFGPELYEFEPMRITVQIGEKVTKEWGEYELSEGAAGWYLPDVSTRSDVEFTGSIYLPETWKNGIPSHRSANYLPDITTRRESIDNLSEYEQSALMYYDKEFWGGGTYYSGGDYGYDPSTLSYEEDGDRINFGSGQDDPSGWRWYIPDVTGGGSNRKNFWSGFFIDRQKCQPGYYLPDLTFDVGGNNYWPVPDDKGYFVQTKISMELDEFVGTRLYEAGWYAPDLESGIKSTDTDGAAYWDKVWIGKGDPIVTVEPIYEDHDFGTWENEHLFVYNESQFVTYHGMTLEQANLLCQRNKGRGWRMPNLKEASLIKIAMENAGIYKTNGLTRYKDVVQGYDVGNFLSCTYREFGVDGMQSRADQTGFYTGVYYPESDYEVSDGDWANEKNGPLLGRIACITSAENRHYYIRCVRDLQASGD